MTIETARTALIWCTLINYGVLLAWFPVPRRARRDAPAARPVVSGLRGQFDLVHYAGMAFFKLGIILFNFVPYLALLMIR